MRTLRTLTLLGLLIASVPGTAEADWMLTPFIGLTFKGETSLFNPEHGVEKTHWSLGGTAGFIGNGPIGAEGIVVYTPGFFQNKNPSDFEEVTPGIVNSRAFALMGNLVLTIPRSWNEYGLRPFVSGGFGLLHASSEDVSSVLPVKANLVGYNVGGGAFGLLTDKVGLRFELRYFSKVPRPGLDESDDPSFGNVRLHFWTSSVGILLRY